jgi:cation:H+ antiporter
MAVLCTAAPALPYHRKETSLLNLALVAAGLVALGLGGEAVVRGALSAALRLGMSPLLAGLVIVGFGTSAPELVVSLDAVRGGQVDIAVGNVVGSNISNILLILGICALLRPLNAHADTLRRDGMTMSGVSFLLILLFWGGTLGRLDAALLLFTLATYLIWAYWTETYHNAPSAELHRQETEAVGSVPLSVTVTTVALVGGLVLLIAGSQLLLTGATALAQAFGISDALIGLTLVAVGTSLPELAVSILAVLRRHADVAVGNVLGSNIFNILGILGIAALVHPLEIDARIAEFDQWVMLTSAVVVLILLYTGWRLSRVEGALLLAGYVAYVALSYFIVG